MTPRPANLPAATELWDGRWWPCCGSHAGRPVFRYGWAPAGLATIRQLGAEGLRPGGQEVVAYLAWGPMNRPRWAYLYRHDLARPKRVLSAGLIEGVRRANAALQVCPTCKLDVGYRIRRSLGECDTCHARAVTAIAA